MKKTVGGTCMSRLLALLTLVAGVASPGAAQDSKAPVYLLEVDGAIGPATTLYLEDGLEKAEQAGSPAVVIRMDTPGGLDAATRDINQAILGSGVPVITWIAPEGARAASAGTYILYASHVAAMAPATNLGAATPVQIGGGMGAPRPEEAEEESEGKAQEDGNGEKSQSPDQAPGGDAMKRKTINDAAAYIRGLAELRGRNADWAEKAVREAVSLTASAALDENVIDIVAEDIQSLLSQADGREVKVRDTTVALDTADREVEIISPDWRSELLSIITNPTVAYLLMMVGLYGLILEGYNPGALVPGVVGAICLLLALFAFQVLPVNYAGLALIALGVILMVAEIFAPSFGVMGIGGIIALIFGSIILLDTDVPGFEISRWVIGGTAAVSGGFFMGVMYLAIRAWGRPVVSGRQQLIGAHATALSDFQNGHGGVHVHGERWGARSEQPVREGDTVVIRDLQGLTLVVEPASAGQ
jgi:membrane-bound serine protease (ClpP class)